jgi:hypothetical protein
LCISFVIYTITSVLGTQLQVCLYLPTIVAFSRAYS